MIKMEFPGCVLYKESMHQQRSHLTKAAGFTLLEMAIALCVLGLLMSGAMAGTSRWYAAQKTAQTRERIDFAMNMLSVYAQAHNRLPCPADLNTGLEACAAGT